MPILLGKLRRLSSDSSRGKGVTGQVLRADLDALARLKPDIDRLAGEVSQGVPGLIMMGGVVDAGAVPSLAAAQQMSTRTLPVIRAAVAGRFTRMAEMIDLARQGFIASEDQLLNVVNTMPTLLRTATAQ
jgi:hypothetical protein